MNSEEEDTTDALDAHVGKETAFPGKPNVQKSAILFDAEKTATGPKASKMTRAIAAHVLLRDPVFRTNIDPEKLIYTDLIISAITFTNLYRILRGVTSPNRFFYSPAQLSTTKVKKCAATAQKATDIIRRAEHLKSSETAFVQIV